MRGGLLKTIAKRIRKLIFTDYDCCYTDMEYRGNAFMGCCSGGVGGTSSTEYLSEMCIGCPYQVMIKHN